LFDQDAGKDVVSSLRRCTQLDSSLKAQDVEVGLRWCAKQISKNATQNSKSPDVPTGKLRRHLGTEEIKSTEIGNRFACAGRRHADNTDIEQINDASHQQ
jgi:hypothetical protein